MRSQRNRLNLTRPESRVGGRGTLCRCKIEPNEGRESPVRPGPVGTGDPNKDLGLHCYRHQGCRGTVRQLPKPILVLLQILHLSHVDSCEI